jgi:hypothetical protein
MQLLVVLISKRAHFDPAHSLIKALASQMHLFAALTLDWLVRPSHGVSFCKCLLCQNDPLARMQNVALPGIGGHSIPQVSHVYPNSMNPAPTSTISSTPTLAHLHDATNSPALSRTPDASSSPNSLRQLPPLQVEASSAAPGSHISHGACTGVDPQWLEHAAPGSPPAMTAAVNHHTGLALMARTRQQKLPGRHLHAGGISRGHAWCLWSREAGGPGKKAFLQGSAEPSFAKEAAPLGVAGRAPRPFLLVCILPSGTWEARMGLGLGMCVRAAGLRIQRSFMQGGEAPGWLLLALRSCTFLLCRMSSPLIVAFEPEIEVFSSQRSPCL